MCLPAHVYPSGHHCCSSHTCEPTLNHCGPRPMFCSTALHTCLPTRFRPASLHGHLDQNVHPICHPISTNHLPRSVRPICQCISHSHHVHHTFHPTCNRRKQAKYFEIRMEVLQIISSIRARVGSLTHMHKY